MLENYFFEYKVQGFVNNRHIVKLIHYRSIDTVITDLIEVENFDNSLQMTIKAFLERYDELKSGLNLHPTDKERELYKRFKIEKNISFDFQLFSNNLYYVSATHLNNSVSRFSKTGFGKTLEEAKSKSLDLNNLYTLIYSFNTNISFRS